MGNVSEESWGIDISLGLNMGLGAPGGFARARASSPAVRRRRSSLEKEERGHITPPYPRQQKRASVPPAPQTFDIQEKLPAHPSSSSYSHDQPFRPRHNISHASSPLVLVVDQPNLLVLAAVLARSLLRHTAPPLLLMVPTQDNALHIVNDHTKSRFRPLKALTSTMPYLPFPKISWHVPSLSHASKHKDYLQALHSSICLEKSLAPRFLRASPTPTTSA